MLVPQHNGGTPASGRCPLTHGDALDAAPRRRESHGVGQDPWHLAVTQGVMHIARGESIVAGIFDKGQTPPPPRMLLITYPGAG